MEDAALNGYRVVPQASEDAVCCALVARGIAPVSSSAVTRTRSLKVCAKEGTRGPSHG